MSDTVARRPADPLAETKRDDNPFECLRAHGAEWVMVAGFFASMKACRLKSPTSFCMNLKYWISKGLTLPDAKMIFRRLCDPEVACLHQFENQLMPALEAMVGDVLRRRRIQAEARRRREAESQPGSAAAVAIGLADGFKLPRSK